MTIFSAYDPLPKPFAVTILLLEESSLLSFASTLDPLRAVNRVTQRRLFDWTLVSFDGNPVTLTSGVSIATKGPLVAFPEGDALIVIAGFNQDRHASRKDLTALAKAARGYRAIGGVEAGSWLLARAGLLNGKAATTHWEDFEDFAAKFPNVDLRTDRFVIDQNTFTCGGASPAFDMMLHLIRSRHGAPLALEVASVFVYDEAHAATDAQPLVSLGRLKEHEPRVSEAIRLMEANIDEPLTVAKIAKRLKLTQRTLEIIFRKALDRSPGDFYLKLRLQAARRLVVDTRLSVQDIAIRAGFNSHTAFSRVFKQVYGAGPRDYRANLI